MGSFRRLQRLKAGHAARGRDGPGTDRPRTAGMTWHVRASRDGAAQGTAGSARQYSDWRITAWLGRRESARLARRHLAANGSAGLTIIAWLARVAWNGRHVNAVLGSARPRAMGQAWTGTARHERRITARQRRLGAADRREARRGEAGCDWLVPARLGDDRHGRRG